MLDRVSVVEDNFLKCIQQGELPVPEAGFRSLCVSNNQLIDWFDSQIKSRLLDIEARRLKDKGQSFYTIGSSGHEGNAVLGGVFTSKDMAFLHYRSSAFFIQRAKTHKRVNGVEEILSSLVASSEDNIASGRHKVFGSVALSIPPQTSTIASHLPKALGAAISITRAKELKLNSILDADSAVYCSFGDASCNHAVSQTTFNACSWLTKSTYPLPLVFVCEDNGLGISVPTPKEWIKESFQDRPGIHYLEADGLDVLDSYLMACEARRLAVVKKQPVFLRFKCVRLLGHAGSDIESQYLTRKQIEAQEAHDPLLYTAHYLLRFGCLSRDDIISLYSTNKKDIERVSARCVVKPKLLTKDAIVESIIPRKRKLQYFPIPNKSERKKVFADKFNQLSIKRNMSQQINFTLTDILAQFPQTLILGEDVGKKGGVYRVTADLQKQFGVCRVFDTLLDETTILGTAIGLAHNGFLPIPEIQFLAYLHNAEDQLRGEAATLSFFSDGNFCNPMVVRVAGLAYQKGFGGHFHNDNSIAFLRDIPGLIIACPSNGLDAARMLRQCIKLAYENGRVVVFLEPIALYMTKDLHTIKDEEWLFHYPAPHETIALGEVGVFGEGDTVILTYGNGYYLSRQAAHILKKQNGIDVKIIDIRWLSPLPMDAILCEVRASNYILIVDECRRTGSLSEALVTALVEHLDVLPNIKRLTAEDCFIPLGEAWQHVLPSRDDIIDAVVTMVKKKARLIK